MISIKRDVVYAMARGCHFCLHIGTVAIYLGSGVRGFGSRLELFTPQHWFRWRRGIRDKEPQE